MKQGTDRLLKFKLLGARLGLDPWEVKGLLQAIWDFAADNAPGGDIGRYDDPDIFFGIGYTRTDPSPQEVLRILIETRWIDPHPQHRLLIHHWPEHCEDRYHMALARRHERFADGKAPRLSRFAAAERKALAEFYENTEKTLENTPPDDALPGTLAHMEAHKNTQGSDGEHTKTHRSTLPSPGPSPGPSPSPTPTPTRCRKPARKKAKAPLPQFSDGFTAFWAIYPRKEHKAEAMALWAELDPDPDQTERILQGTRRYLARDQVRDAVARGEYRRIRLATTFLNNRQWLDDEDHPPPSDPGEPLRGPGVPAPRAPTDSELAFIVGVTGGDAGNSLTPPDLQTPRENHA